MSKYEEKNGFLDNLPDLDLGESQRYKKPQANISKEVVIRYIKLKCPFCGHDKVPVYNSENLPIRYHKCAKCGKCFKSIEK